MIVSVPASARGEEPVTGASSIRTPRALSCAAIRRLSRGEIVDMSTHSRSARAASITPPSPSSTEATCSPSTTMLTTMSLLLRDLGRRVDCDDRLVRGGPGGGLAGRVRPDRQRKAGLRDPRGHPRAHDPEAEEADSVAQVTSLRPGIRLRALSGRPRAPDPQYRPGADEKGSSRCAIAARAGRRRLCAWSRGTAAVRR